MAKKKEMTGFGKVLGFLVWLTGVIVSLAVGFGMIDGVLTIFFNNASAAFNNIISNLLIFFGWVIVITTILGVILAIVKKFE